MGVLDEGLTPRSDAFTEAFLRPVRLRFDEALAEGEVDRPIELVVERGRGLPVGTAKAVEDVWLRLHAGGALLIFGPGVTDNSLVFAFLLHAGLRRSEALALQWSDGELVVTEPKTAKSKRFVPISAPAEQLLQAVHAAQQEERRRPGIGWRETGVVFTTELGEPCDPRNAFRALRVAATKSGLPHAGLHTLRHSVANVMLTGGCRSRWSPRSSVTPR